MKAESIFELPFGECCKESLNANTGRDLKRNVIRPPLFLWFKQDLRGRLCFPSSLCTWSSSKWEGIKAHSLGPQWSHYGVTFNETVHFKLGTNHHGRIFLQLWARAKQNKTSVSEALLTERHSYHVQLPQASLNTHSRCNELSWFELHCIHRLSLFLRNAWELTPLLSVKWILKSGGPSTNH